MNNEMKSMKNVKANRQAKIMNKVVDGTVSLDNLQAMENIDFLNVLNPIQLMQKIYNAESLVGAVTVVVGNICNVDVTDPAAFKEFKEKLVMLKGNKAHASYGDSIWVQGVNVFMGYHFTTGHFYCYYQVTNAEMKAIEDKIAKMSKSKMTVADALALQSDLTPILRAWQESSIDVTKDKTKKFNYDFRKFFKKIDVVSTFCKKHADEIVMNSKTVYKDADKNQFKITLPSDNNEEVCKDLVGDVTEEIRTAAEEFYNGDVLDLLKYADMEAYKPFVGYAREHKELAIFIKDIYQLCYNSLNDKTAKLTKDDYALLRNVIYTKAFDLGMEFADVVKVAIDVAMTTVKETKEGIVVGNSDVTAFRQYPVKNIFVKEYHVALSNKPYMETIATEEDILVLERNIKDKEEIEFTNGVSADGKIEILSNFTGIATECNGVLVAPADLYAFEEVRAMLVHKTFDEAATPKQMIYDVEGKYLTKLIDTLNFSNIRVTGKACNALRNDGHLIAVFRGTVAFGSNEYITIEDVKSFVPRNGSQKYFLIIAK
jgi:hypothetical protein